MSDFERVIKSEADVEWNDVRLSDYWLRTFSFFRGQDPYWGTFVIQFTTVPEGLRTKSEPEALGMIGTCQCHLIQEEDFSVQDDEGTDG